MATGSALRELATFVEACESGAGTVTGVCFAECVDPTADDALRADVELTLSADAGASDAVSLRSRIDADGRLTLALESGDSVVPTEGHAVAVEPADVTVDGDGTVTVTLSAAAPTDGDAGPATSARPAAAASSVEGSGDDRHAREAADSEEGSDADSEPTADARAAPASPERDRDAPPERDRDVPPFRDRDLLASVYESEDTFAEMADRLEMDVTAETVRRYMIDYDIHEPDSYDTGASAGDGAADATTDAGDDGADGATVGAVGDEDADGAAASDDASPVVLSDGIGLPDDVTVDTLIESVKRSNTIYEVTQDVDMGRHEALEMLQDLNLLDLVVGRLATETDRNITREDVVSRLREASAVQ